MPFDEFVLLYLLMMYFICVLGKVYCSFVLCVQLCLSFFIFGRPTLVGIGGLRILPRPSVRACVRKILNEYFSEICHEVRILYGGKWNILGFLKIILVASPGALVWPKKAPKCPKVAKMTLFALYHLIHPLFFLKLSQNVEAIVQNIKTTIVDLGKILVSISGGLLGLKIPLLGLLFSNLSNYWYVCLFSGFPWSWTKK